MQNSKAIAQFAKELTYNAIPTEVIDQMKVSILYNISIALAGNEIVDKAVHHIFKIEDRPAPTEQKWFRTDELPIDRVVFSNACLITSRGQNETLYKSFSHPGCVIIPGALALSEQIKTDGKQLLTALVAGYESTAALAENIAEKTIKKGFRSTSLYSPLGSVITNSKLLNHTEKQFITALSLVSNFSSGQTQTWMDGTDEWIFQVGKASQDGIISALIADNDQIQGTENALDGPKGFYHSLIGEYVESYSESLGTKWETLNIQYKPYPSCALNQLPMYAVMRLKDEYDICTEQIKHVTVHLSPSEYYYPGLLERPPFVGRSSAIMSLPFALAICFLHEQINFRLFENCDDLNIIKFMDKIIVKKDDTLQTQQIRITIQLKSGKIVQKNIEDVEGALSFNWPRVVSFAKALKGEMKITEEKLTNIITTIENLEQIDDVSKLVSIISEDSRSNR